MEKNSSKDRGTVLWRFSQKFQFAADKIIPDSLVFCLILTFIVYVAALIFTDRGPVQLCLDWYNHAWDMLASAAAVDPDTSDEKTPEQIKKHIQRIINQENKSKPLSDQKICTLLEAYAIHISRRTVNKYRSEMNIPDKIGRKAWA